MRIGQEGTKISIRVVNPDRVIDETIRSGDWFAGFSNSVT